MRRILVGTAVALTIVAGVLVKLVVAVFAADFNVGYWRAAAEALVGAHTPLAGYAGALTYTAELIGGFVLGTLVLTAFAPRRMLAAAAASAAIYGLAALSFGSGWVFGNAEIRNGAKMIATNSYVKWPPVRAAEDLQDAIKGRIWLVLGVDVVVALAIARHRPRANGGAPLNTADTSPAAS